MIDLHTFIDKLLLRISYVTWEWLPINPKFCAIDHHSFHGLSISSHCAIDKFFSNLRVVSKHFKVLSHRSIEPALLSFHWCLINCLQIDSTCDWYFQMKASSLQWTMTLPSLHTHTHTHYTPRRCHILFYQCEIRLEHLSSSVKCLTSYFPTSKHQKSSNNCCWRTQKKNDRKKTKWRNQKRS